MPKPFLNPFICAAKGHSFNRWQDVERTTRAQGDSYPLTGFTYPITGTIAVRKCLRCNREEKALTRKDAIYLRSVAIATGHDKLYKFASAQLEKVRNG